MLPNMFKIAGELTPDRASTSPHARSPPMRCRSSATTRMSWRARTTGFAMLAPARPCRRPTISRSSPMPRRSRRRVPFLHFFDGFRTSHEVSNTIEVLDDDDAARAGRRAARQRAHRDRALSTPIARCCAAPPRTPTCSSRLARPRNPFYARGARGRAADHGPLGRPTTGRPYHLVDYRRPPDAERVIVLMGSGCRRRGGGRRRARARAGERVGVVKVRLFRPFSTDALVAALPPERRARSWCSIARRSPVRRGEPLYQDVVTALAEATGPADLGCDSRMPRVHRRPLRTVVEGVHARDGQGGVRRSSTTPTTPATVHGRHRRRRHPHSACRYDPTFDTEHAEPCAPSSTASAADGTVGANKNSIQIIGEHTDLHAQGYFVYDSKKSGSMTISHLRFGPHPIRSTLPRSTGPTSSRATSSSFLERIDVLDVARIRAPPFLFNSPYRTRSRSGTALPVEVHERIIERGLQAVRRRRARRSRGEAGLGTTHQHRACRRASSRSSGVIPTRRGDRGDQGRDREDATARTRRDGVIERNFAAVDAALDGLHEVRRARRRGDAERATPAAGAGRSRRSSCSG